MNSILDVPLNRIIAIYIEKCVEELPYKHRCKLYLLNSTPLKNPTTFLTQLEKYSRWNSDGIPTHDHEGRELDHSSVVNLVYEHRDIFILDVVHRILTPLQIYFLTISGIIVQAISKL
jgi:hypothetical protein